MSWIVAALAVILLFAVMNFYCSVQILRRVSNNDGKLNFFELRYQVHKHMKEYCRLTRAEDGRIGSACYGYWLSFLAMLAAIYWLILLLGDGSFDSL